jgi:hypothetical protein
MVAEIIAAALVAVSPTPTATPAEQLTTPLRVVVYDVSTTERVDDITESFGGGPGAVPPASTLEGEEHGTVTVDVMAKFDDGVLGVKVIEQWKVPPLPLHFTGAVAPDGTVEFALTTINAATIELLPYFATRFSPDGALASGSHWSVNKVSGNTSVSTDYEVTAVGVDSVTIHKDTTIKELGSETVDGTVEYDPALLVAISGRLRVRRTDMFADGQTTHTIDLNFNRVSDTFQTPAKS